MADPVETRVARIESDVQYIKADTTDLRVEQRRTNDRVDALAEKTETGFKELNKKIDDVYKELNKKIDDVYKDLIGRFDSLKDKLHSLTVWALVLYITLAGGMLTIIARAFKWI